MNFLQIKDSLASDTQEVVGIDLGTTNSAVSIICNGKPKVLEIENSELVPSVVALTKGNKWIAGKKALLEKNAVYSFKRLMHCPMQLTELKKTPIELSAILLNYIRSSVEKILEKKIIKAVITVPAYFDEPARQATKEAALLAGLSTLRLISEPTAAAIAYGIDKNLDGIYAVYDFGGGTFDFSLLELKGGFFRVLATGGDTELGGDDIDKAIVNLWQTDNSNNYMEFLNLARSAKESLFKKENWNETFCDKKMSFSKSELNTVCAPFINKTLEICHSTLKDANKKIEDINGVLLVGGSTRLNCVKEAVCSFFKQKPLDNIDPDLIVSMGAALKADSLVNTPTHTLLDVIPLSLGIETMGGVVEKMILRNTPIPISTTEEFTTFKDGQTKISIHVVQGERELIKDCRSLAQFTLKGIPPLKVGAVRICVTFTIDADGLLTVSAFEKTTQKHQEITVKPTFGLNQNDFEKMIKEGNINAADDIKKRFDIEALLEANKVYESLSKSLKEERELETKNIKEALYELKNLIDIKADSSTLQKCIKKLTLLSIPLAKQQLQKVLTSCFIGKPIKKIKEDLCQK
ncbi:MAG: Hsp70 family protein [Alphaproteobacteria bacterium]